MDCNEYLERVSAAVDSVLSQEDLSAFTAHGNACPGCKLEYELEKATKAFVARRVHRVRAPAVLAGDISRRLEVMEGATGGIVHWWQGLFEKRYAKPVLAVALASLALVLYLNVPAPSPFQNSGVQLASGDVMFQSLANYAKIVKGEIQPQVVSDSPEVLQTFFAGKTEFPVVFPPMRDCKLVGGVVNEFSGIALAHVVYKHGPEVVYMYQTCRKRVEDGRDLHLPTAVMAALKNGEWFAETRPNGESIVVWAKGETVCSAVAHMPKDELIACLEVTNGPW